MVVYIVHESDIIVQSDLRLTDSFGLEFSCNYGYYSIGDFSYYLESFLAERIE